LVAIFGSSSSEPASSEWKEAENAGARFASAGLGVITGGYSGTMAAASKGAAEAGAEAIGVTVPGLFVQRTGANPHITREIEARSLTERIGILTDRARGALVLPGSIGTATELLVAWNINHVVRRHGGRRLPTVAVGEEWSELWQLLTGHVGAFGGDIHLAGTTDEAVDWLLEQPEIH
jgi:uncharacterized protein (TIGR00725 family)